jgi:hypothetical protein
MATVAVTVVEGLQQEEDRTEMLRFSVVLARSVFDDRAGPRVQSA